MNSKFFIGLVVLLVGLLVGWYVLGGKSKLEFPKKDMTTPQVLVTPGSTTGGAGQGAAEGTEKGGVNERTVVTYTDKGFAPSPVTVKVGSVVSFVNESGGGMWVASDPHPQHSIYPEFDQKISVGKGQTYEFAFAKVGTWKYHNHMKPEDTGSVVVTQ